jgi:hypothetical protein
MRLASNRRRLIAVADSFYNEQKCEKACLRKYE